MAVTTNKAVLFLLGGVAAAAVVAYGAGMFGPPRQPETIAALPEAGQADQKDARLPGADQPAEQPAAALQPPAQPSAPETATPAAPEAAPPAPAAPESAGELPVVPPSFDVVRVEGDGSIVIAGMAAPSAKVDLLVGSNVIGSATAGVDGTFAVVLDDPLKPGDYQIVLRATAPDNVVAMSVETAVVSVPETPDGQVLALVEEPGKPSQMITLPAPQAPAAAAKPPEAAAAPPAAETPSATEAPAVAEPKPEGEMQAALPQEAKPAAPAPLPPAGPAVRVDAVEIDGRKIFVAGSAEPGRTVRGYANEILLGDAKVSPDGSYLIEAERDLPVGDYIIRVDALEPDGVKVAARAAVPFEREPGETIAAVAPQAPVTPPATEAPAAPAAALAKGADTGGGAPATAMPPVADAPVAAAPATEGTDTGGGAPATATPAAAAQAPAAPAAPAAVAEAPGAQTPPAAGAADMPAPATEAPAAADAASGATAPAAEPPAATATPPAAEPPAATAQAPAAQAPATDAQTGAAGAPAAGTAAQETPASPPAVAEAPAAEMPAAEPPPVAAPPAGAATATDAPEAAPPAAAETETDIAAAPAEDNPLPEPPAAGVSEVLAPKLQSAGGAVIIRRGDSLWRISRRVYGRGVRYSTIYLANQTQIEDPDRIWPGQVFKVPEKSADGEAEADYSTLGNRLTTAPEQSAE